jgi:hypothetical protein
VAEHRGAAREDAGSLADEERAEQCRHEPLERVDEDDRKAEPPPKDAPRVRPADVAAAVAADVGPLDRADEPVPGRDRAGEVAGDDGDERCYVWIW